jgi:hypothetical protein
MEIEFKRLNNGQIVYTERETIKAYANRAQAAKRLEKLKSQYPDLNLFVRDGYPFYVALSTSPLTPDTAKTARYIISKIHPEWGIKRFNYMSQPLPVGTGYAHTWGTGSDSAVLFEEDFKFWGVVN